MLTDLPNFHDVFSNKDAGRIEVCVAGMPDFSLQMNSCKIKPGKNSKLLELCFI